MAQEIYVVIEFDRETHEFSEIEAICQSKEEAENLVKEYNAKFLRYSYEWFEGTYHDEEVDSVLAEKDAEIRRLQRAVWVAREWRAWCEVHFWFVNPSNTQRDVYHLACTNRIHRTSVEWMAYWQKVEHLCRQKAQAEDDCAYWKTMAQKNAAETPKGEWV